jgi:hypothetical protein
MCPQVKEWGSHQKQQEMRKGFLLGVLEESKALLTAWFPPSETDFELLASRAVREHSLLF